jgi:hypothetical protein
MAEATKGNTMSQTTEKNHAIENAKGHLESIRDLVGRWKANEDGTPGDESEREFDEYPLSVEVREAWRTLADYDPDHKPAEYKITLTTGGPALRIIGELDQYGQPESATMEWQDWGTPWTELHGADMPFEPSKVDEILLAFAQHFYFGDG